MGLDQTAHAYHPGDLPEHEEEIAYWRKHHRLQDWMCNLWEEKGRPRSHADEDGTYCTFNCIPVYLNAKDLDRLEMDVNNNELPASGWGDDSDEGYEDYYKAEDLAFIDKAREKLTKGYKVWYNSWW